MNQSDDSIAADVQKIHELIKGNWFTQSIYVAAKLQIADHLADKQLDLKILADLCECNQNSLYRFLRALSSIGIVNEISEKKFFITPLGSLLRSDNEHGIYWIALLQGEERYFAWGDLLMSVKSGKSAYIERFCSSPYEYASDSPKSSTVFNKAMSQYSAKEARALAAAYDFSKHSHLVDIGGGDGTVLRVILEHCPETKGTLIDLPDVIETCNIASSLESRMKMHGCDAFTSSLPLSDAYILKNVLHNWGDKKCIDLLKNIRAAIDSSASKLLICEKIVSLDEHSRAISFLDLNMLVVHESGRERTVSEFSLLLKSAGFIIDEIIPTLANMSIIKAVASSKVN